jgi:hypothetical protein
LVGDEIAPSVADAWILSDASKRVANFVLDAIGCVRVVSRNKSPNRE